MTPNEIRNLINKKLLGQGSMIDVGGVLPAVLLNLLDLIEEGGGGGTADAVQYIPQILTEPQQMQARKNQGLYYEEEGLVEKTLIVTQPDLQSKAGTEDFIQLSGDLQYGKCVIKIGEDTPLAENIKSVYLYDLNVELVWSDDIIVRQSSGYVSVESDGGDLYVVYEDNTLVESTYGNFTASKGIWSYHPISDSMVGVDPNTGADFGLMGVKYDYEGVTIHHIEPKYIKDMYYEEEGVKTINYDINGSRVGTYTKVSDEIIEASAVIGHKFTSYSSDNGNTEYTITEDMVIAADSTHPTRILFDSSDPNSWAILIFPEDMVFEEDSFSKGVWFGDGGTIVHPNHIESLEYDGVTVHQIPAKYIPSTQTVPAVKMEVPSMGNMEFSNIGFIILNQYVTSRQVEVSVDGKTIQSIEVLNFTDPTAPVADVSISDNIITINQGGIFVILVYLTDDKECVGILFCDNYV